MDWNCFVLFSCFFPVPFSCLFPVFFHVPFTVSGKCFFVLPLFSSSCHALSDVLPHFSNPGFSNIATSVCKAFLQEYGTFDFGASGPNRTPTRKANRKTQEKNMTQRRRESEYEKKQEKNRKTEQEKNR